MIIRCEHLVQQLRCPFACLHALLECLSLSTSCASRSSSLLMHTLPGCRCQIKCLNYYHLLGKPRLSFRLLYMDWPYPNCFKHLGYEPVDERSLFVSVYLSAFQVNKNKWKITMVTRMTFQCHGKFFIHSSIF